MPHMGVIVQPPRLPKSVEEKSKSLTPSQREVMALYCKGLRSKEIADVRGCTSRTVEHHASAAIDRLGASTLAEAAVLYDRGVRENR